MHVIATTIDSGWEAAERLAPNRDLSFPRGGEKTWIPARVPGHIHSDLVEAGIIGDPFWRMQETGCRWVDEADWTYRTSFNVTGSRLAVGGERGRHFLHFHGLDTLCRIYLNGTLIGESENFFVPCRLDVTDTLQEGENELRIEFDSALRIGQERAAAYLGDGTTERGAQSYFNFGPRAFVRKPQYMFGWDWGPELISCGVWQPVELVTVPAAEIVDWRYDYTFLDETTVDVRFTATVEKHDDRPLLVGSSLFAPGKTTAQVELTGGPGRYMVELPVEELAIQRWNQNGSGLPAKRYLLNLRLYAENAQGETELIHLRTGTVGFRTIELVREPDPSGGGEGFLFRINGTDTYIKGANWIPDGNFPGEISRGGLRERLTQARDAGMNMLRIWGGGLYETDTFYELCDELGILVWQDFAFACSMYPDDDEGFVDQVRQEAVAAVRRLRTHPSLALWCGGNENAELARDHWAGPMQATRFLGERLILETLPAVLTQEDPHTPYWPNSPWGGEHPQSEDYGDNHYWNVWHSKKPGSSGDWVNYAESDCRFSSEFGFGAPAGLHAWNSCMAPEDHEVRSLVSRHHDKTRKGYETYLGFIGMHYPELQTFEDLVYYGQANQADALKFGVEHWRRRKGRCWGTLFWQINDCWPTHSWAVIDSAGEPKAAYYAAKRFYAPLLLSLRHDGETIEAYLVNDTLAEVPGTLRLQLVGLEGGVVEAAQTVTVAPANAAQKVLTFSLNDDLLPDEKDLTRRFVLHAVFVGQDGATLAENVLLLTDPKHLELPEPGLKIEVEAVGEGAATLTISAERFAGSVWLHFDALDRVPTFSDNWFHLLPGEVRTLTVGNLPAGLSPEELRTRLRARHL